MRFASTKYFLRVCSILLHRLEHQPNRLVTYSSLNCCRIDGDHRRKHSMSSNIRAISFAWRSMWWRTTPIWKWSPLRSIGFDSVWLCQVRGFGPWWWSRVHRWWRGMHWPDLPWCIDRSRGRAWRPPTIWGWFNRFLEEIHPINLPVSNGRARLWLTQLMVAPRWCHRWCLSNVQILCEIYSFLN